MTRDDAIMLVEMVRVFGAGKACAAFCKLYPEYYSIKNADLLRNAYRHQLIQVGETIEELRDGIRQRALQGYAGAVRVADADVQGDRGDRRDDRGDGPP